MVLRLRCLSLLKQGRLFLNQLKQVHQQLVVNGFNNPRNNTSHIGHLIGGYSAFDIGHARLVFQCTDNPNVFIWNVMMRCMPAEEGIRLFVNGCAVKDLVFDDYSYVFGIGACARLMSREGLLGGKQIHCRAIKTGFVNDVVVHTTAIHFYVSHGECGFGRRVFDEMPERTSVTWGAMIAGYCSQKKRADYYAGQGLLLFCELLCNNEARVTDTTIVSVLTGCSRIGDLRTGSCIHGYIEKTISVPLGNIYIGTCLVDMYSRCGCINSAMNVFNELKIKNIQTWTSMMTGLALHGRGREALETLHAMRATGIAPNTVTFTSLLCACCHAGLVEEGLVLFNSMSSTFAVTPRIQHYGCIVDLLGRSGQLQEAYEFVVKMPIQPDAILWRSLLASCTIHGDVVMGERVGKHLVHLQQQTLGSCEDFIALSNVYALAERWEDLEMVRNTMRSQSIQIEPGGSSV